MNELNILTTPGYWDQRKQNLIEALGSQVRLLIDSGAFAAWKHGKPAILADYIAFLRQMEYKPWGYFNLDVVGDPVASWRNYNLMLDAGLRPIPIFTRGASLDELDRYYESTDIVAVGGLVGTTRANGYLRHFMDAVAGRQVHWLGVASPALLRYYKPYSCDSSSAQAAARYGSLHLYLGKGRFKNIAKTDARQRIPADLWGTIESYGYAPRDLGAEANWRGKNAIAWSLSAASRVRYAMESAETFGTMVFLAVPQGPDMLMKVIQGYLYEERRHEGRAVLGRA